MRYAIIIFAALSGCAFNNHLVKQCPGGKRLVVIERSQSSNAYLATISEEARTWAKCAKLDLDESLEEKRREE